jgi:CubicO group peptidase (beta-lactamase class C family)
MHKRTRYRRHLPFLLTAMLSACTASTDKDPSQKPGPSDDTSAPGGDSGGADDTGTPADLDFSDIDALINGYMDTAPIPALGASLMINGEVVWAAGYGWADIDNEIPATGDTAFMLASVSKTFVATALMQQVEKGVFTLDTPVNDLIDFSLDNPRIEDEVVTVRDLATHTGSLCDRWIWGEPGQKGGLYSEGDPTMSLEDLLKSYLIEGGDLYSESNFCLWDPGTRYAYSNIGADLAGYLLESTGDQALDDHSETHIFGPLGMENTGWHLADHDEANVALPYDWMGGEYNAYGHFGYPDYPCGMLRSSPRDLGRYLAAYANGGELDGVRILESSTIDEIFASQIPGVDTTQGVFWYWTQIGNRDVVGHGGADYGVSTDIMLDPATGIGVTVLLNTSGNNTVWAAQSNIQRALFAKGDALLAAQD